MLGKNNIPVVVDFGSCTPVGHSLEHAGQTYQWHNEKFRVATPANDLYALEEIREWLREEGPKRFRFTA